MYMYVMKQQSLKGSQNLCTDLVHFRWPVAPYHRYAHNTVTT